MEADNAAKRHSPPWHQFFSVIRKYCSTAINFFTFNQNIMDKNNERDQNSMSHKQSDYAGTNPDRYGQPAPESEQDNPVNNNEAQNVNDDGSRLSGEEAEQARNKAEEGIRQGRNS
jgi:hypothetical protein